jgi:hypothetical protein
LSPVRLAGVLVHRVRPADAGPPAGGKAAAARLAAEPNPAGTYAYTTARTGNLHDFDFIAGAWTLDNRRLNKRWVADKDNDGKYEFFKTSSHFDTTARHPDWLGEDSALVQWLARPVG